MDILKTMEATNKIPCQDKKYPNTITGYSGSGITQPYTYQVGPPLNILLDDGPNFKKLFYIQQNIKKKIK